MWLYTGDESGLIKVIDTAYVVPPEEQEKQMKKKKMKNMTQEEIDAEKAKMPHLTKAERRQVAEQKRHAESLMSKIHKVQSRNRGICVIGSGNKEKAVQKMTWTVIDGTPVVVVARKDGEIEVIDVEKKDVMFKYVEQEIRAEKIKKEKPSVGEMSRFIGLEATPTHLLTCTSKGRLTWTQWGTKKLTTLGKVCLGNNLSVLRMHPVHKHIFATGGKEIDLRIYDMSKILTDMVNAKVPDFAHEQLPSNIGLIHVAKNVPHDELDLRQPVHVRDIEFLDKDDYTKVAVSTHFGQIRKYDFKAGRRPQINQQIGKLPIQRLLLGPDRLKLIYSNTQNGMGLVDVETMDVVGQFKGISGCVKDMVIVPRLETRPDEDQSTGPMIAAASMDRRLYLHQYPMNDELINVKPVRKYALMQHLTAVLHSDKLFVEDKKRAGMAATDDEDDDEALWNKMPTIQKTVKRKMPTNDKVIKKARKT
ncbi:hypothetical protein BC940DRAFT_293373 [Gongronella butleri]|nr:hypothetical protein BC940DRAFT_293373 [Gongronella butleri]